MLDEIDHYADDRAFLCNILEWIGLPNSKIILIMISNKFNLEEMFHLNMSKVKIESVLFKPYDADAIMDVLHDKYPLAKDIFD